MRKRAEPGGFRNDAGGEVRVTAWWSHHAVPHGGHDAVTAYIIQHGITMPDLDEDVEYMDYHVLGIKREADPGYGVAGTHVEVSQQRPGV